MIPLTVNVSRYNDSQPRKYNCRIADNRMLTPRLLRAVVMSAGLFGGEMPPDNTVSYKGTIKTDGAGTIAFDNVSTGEGLDDAVRDTMSPLGLLINNPYRQVRIKSINVDLDIREKDITSDIWSVGLPGSSVKRGDNLNVEVVNGVGAVAEAKVRFQFYRAGEHPCWDISVDYLRRVEYEEFLKKAVPHRFVPEDLDTWWCDEQDFGGRQGPASLYYGFTRGRGGPGASGAARAAGDKGDGARRRQESEYNAGVSRLD